MGIVALREPPSAIPEPLHRMAIRLRRQAQSRRVEVDPALHLSPAETLEYLAVVRQRCSLREDWTLVRECLKIERQIRLGGSPQLRRWLRREVWGVRRRREAPARQLSGIAATNATKAFGTTSAPEQVITEWASFVPLAPDTAGLPPLSAALRSWAKSHVEDLDANGELWLRWASMHASYMHESIRPGNTVSPGALDLLARLGRAWMRVALIERLRRSEGEFTSSDEVSIALRNDDSLRRAVANWLAEVGGAYLGKGEAAGQVDGRAGKAIEVVGLQLLGALALVSGSYISVKSAVDEFPFQATDQSDWRTLLQLELKHEPEMSVTRTGPDHASVFEVAIRDHGRFSTGRGSSLKAARQAAARSFLSIHIPAAVAYRRKRAPMTAPTIYDRPGRGPARTVQALQGMFGLPESSLIWQAVTHSSWVHENQTAVRRARQRSYEPLATEGSEILCALVYHRFLVSTLRRSLVVTGDEAVMPEVSGDSVALLFDALHLGDGVLMGNGASPTAQIRADVVQAVTAAAWRSSPGRLVEQQPRALHAWVASLGGQLDPATQLDRLSVNLGVTYGLEFDVQGPDHEKRYRATYRFAGERGPVCRGPWKTAKTAAKKAAASAVLDRLVDNATFSPDGDGQPDPLLTFFLLAEVRQARPDITSPIKEIAARRLGVDALAAGAISDFATWAHKREPTLGRSPGTLHRLREYYTNVLTLHRRERLETLIAESCPSQAGDGRTTCLPGGAGHQGLRVLYDALAALRPDSAELGTTLSRWSEQTDIDHTIETTHSSEGALSPGVASLLELLLRHAEGISRATGSCLEVATADEDGAHVAVVIRVAGVDLEQTMRPLLNAVAALLTEINWRAEDNVISVQLPTLPTPPTGGLMRTAIESIGFAIEDSWLDNLRSSLENALAAVESIETSAMPTEHDAWTGLVALPGTHSRQHTDLGREII